MATSARRPIYTTKLDAIRGSMSRKGNCWDNAVTETLFGSLKVERLHGRRFETRRQAKDEVVDWLVFYNRKRLHSTLDRKSPMAFEEIWRRQQRIPPGSDALRVWNVFPMFCEMAR